VIQTEIKNNLSEAILFGRLHKGARYFWISTRTKLLSLPVIFDARLCPFGGSSSSSAPPGLPGRSSGHRRRPERGAPASCYSNGIFPWYSDDEPVLWWSRIPDWCFTPGNFTFAFVAKVIRRCDFSISMDRAFEQVMRECAGVRSRSGEGTWVVPDMIEAYCRLHLLGYAHSSKPGRTTAWQGVCTVFLWGRCFFGESMFTRVSNASKVALAHLVAYLGRKALT